MTLPLWGEMQKSVDDPQTIVQAIVAYIAEHEADPEAHLGAGESLEQHKAEDILDHPVGSVLTDKYSMTELELIFNGRVSGSYSLINRGFAAGQNGFNLQLYDGDTDTYYTQSVFRMQVPDSTAMLDFDKDMLVDGLMIIPGLGQGGSLYFGLIDWNFATTFNPNIGMGFEIVNDELRGFLGLGATRYTTDEIMQSLTTLAFYRVVWNPSTQIASYYVNGNLVDTISAPTFSGADSSVRPVFMVSGNGTTDEMQGFLYNFYYSRGLVNP